MPNKTTARRKSAARKTTRRASTARQEVKLSEMKYVVAYGHAMDGANGFLCYGLAAAKEKAQEITEYEGDDSYLHVFLVHPDGEIECCEKVRRGIEIQAPGPKNPRKYRYVKGDE